MKTYLTKITILSLLIVVFISCDNQLERLPKDFLIEETAYNTVSDLEAGLTGAIGGLDYRGILSFNAIFTDNAKLGANNGGQKLDLLNQLLTSNSGDQSIWATRYSFINDLNRLIAASSNITPLTTAELNTYNNVLAQAYAFRALAHYETLLYYGFDITDPSSLGVPYTDYVSTGAQPARNTTGEVITAIKADLTNAFSLLPSSATDINFITQDFITFLRARIALETQAYSDCITLCNDLIANYALADQTQYFNMFNEDANTTEVIWKYDNVQGFAYIYAAEWRFTAGVADNGFMEMSNELENLFNSNDVRRSVNLDPNSNVSLNEYLIGKYPPNADTNYINDFKGMRISEIYLIRAEAYARLAAPNFTMAVADVNAIRNARITTPSPISFNNINDALTTILAERRLELAYEGHRYIDIKRMRDVLNTGINKDASDCGGSVPCSMSVNSEKWILPIPISEVNANPNLIQAPNY